jgi:LytS/YehU family sensor histidine kinase
VFVVDRRASGGTPRWQSLTAIVLIVAVGAMVGYSVGTSLVDLVLGTRSHSLFGNRTSVITTLIAAVTMTYFFHSRERLQAERTAAEAARRLALENQLKLIESQLEPHMLFNTLANLRVLIGLDPPRAQAMLDRLIAYLRATLNASRSGGHPLAAEFERLADYLALMAVRMGPRLVVAFHLPDDLRQVTVPPLLLQPVVENAIKHGLEPKVEGGRIEVRAERAGDGPGATLLLSVRDTGVGLGAAPAPAPGTTEGLHYGTSHVRERLATLYGDRARFELQPAVDAEGGTLALLGLPLTLPPATPAPATATA